MDGAIKHDAEKESRPELIAPEFIHGTACVLSDGAKKYAPGNWALGMKWSRVYGALQRHLNAWWGGESKDPESGRSHLWHACCCLMFLVAYEARGIGNDDRKDVGASKK